MLLRIQISQKISEVQLGENMNNLVTTFNEAMELTDFPFDIQALSLQLSLGVSSQLCNMVLNNEYPSTFSLENFLLVDVFLRGSPRPFLRIDTTFCLHNHGASLPNQPWRILTSIFTSSNLFDTFFNYAAQISMFSFMYNHSLSAVPLHHLMLALLASCALGNFAAGMAFPRTVFASGFTSTSVLAGFIAPRAERKPRAASIMVLLLSVVASLGKNHELLSHCVAGAFFHAFERSATHYGGIIAVGFGCALLTVFSLHQTVGWLSFLAPQLDVPL